ncbi:CHAP domain-containing protein [Ferruginibacter albus]|uniref:CHAP domain-containing protein n=1 Tax=Ferruginibacter albus TaxID=2875540 RepID=UPI001CC809AC|nr:glycoside hydrolase family 75 protein [Ferruginibacter albus]UAY53243.1 glycoside hydrolase family 75 protein [Ferruginibacter albus]
MPSTAKQLLDRARSLLGRHVTYKLGQGGFNPDQVPDQFNGTQLDCSGFVAWCLGINRHIANQFYATINGENGRGWFETSAVYKDAQNSAGILTQITNPIPGCIAVYGDYSIDGINHQGHIGIITEVDIYHKPIKVIHCSASNYNTTGDAVQENASQALINNNKVIFAWVDALPNESHDPINIENLFSKFRPDLKREITEKNYLSVNKQRKECFPLFEYRKPNKLIYQSFYYPEENSFFFQSKAAICADGAPNAYKIGDMGIDYLANAGKPPYKNAPTDSNLNSWQWYGIVTDKENNPIVQSAEEPAPSFFVSQTAQGNWQEFPDTDQRCYVNANEIPYIVLPSNKGHGARLGDFAYVVDKKTQNHIPAIFSEIGPQNKLGEMSIKAAQMLGINANPKTGGSNRKDFFYIVFLNSGNNKPRTYNEIVENATNLFEQWGGLKRVSEIGDISV